MISSTPAKPPVCQICLYVFFSIFLFISPSPAWAKSGSATTVLTFSEAARYLRISKGEMKYLLKSRQVPYRRINGKVRISRIALERFLNRLDSVNSQNSSSRKPLSDGEAKNIIGGRSGRPKTNALEPSSSGLERKKFQVTQNLEADILKQELASTEEEKTLVEYLSLRGVGILLEKNQLEVEGGVSYLHSTARGQKI